jgi:plasmid stabilization system protein ParE
MTSRIEVILSPRSRRDWSSILQYTLKVWGTGQRDTYDLILLDAIDIISRNPDLVTVPKASRRTSVCTTLSTTTSSTGESRNGW